MSVRIGLEVLFEEGAPELPGRRIGLITNHTGVDSHFRAGIDVLHASPHFKLAALFGPEHGVRGDAQAGAHVAATEDERTGLPVWRLYGATRRPTAEMLKGLDALVFDIQDVGVRYATYLSTLAYAQEVAAEHGLAFAVLDRPNPLSGAVVEGNMLDPAWASFVGIHPLPVRHGMTVGELARLFAAERGWPAPLVVPMHGWQRQQWFDQTGLPWVQPSPNLPTLDSLTLYGGTCLIEGTNVSEGRGTTRPFELVGAPWIDPFRLAEALTACNLPGAAFRPAYFAPTFSKHAGETCAGVQIHIVDRLTLRPFELGLHLLHTLRKLYPDSFAWQQGQDNRHFVDLLLGGDEIRRAFDTGAEVADVMSGLPEQLAEFQERRRPFLMYHQESNARADDGCYRGT